MSSVALRFTLVLVWLLISTSARALYADNTKSTHANALRSAGYEVLSGDVNSDGFPDLFLRSTQRFVVIPSDIGIPVLGRRAQSFVVISDRTGAYSTVVPITSEMQLNQAWQTGTHELLFGDTDGDGSAEMLVRALSPNQVSLLLTTSLADGAPLVRQRLSAGDLGGIDIGVRGTVIDLLDIDSSGRDSLLVARGPLVQAIFLASRDGKFENGPPNDSGESVAVRAGESTQTGGQVAAAAAVQTVAGATPGFFDVSRTGAATYFIPIWSPDGPKGIQPEVGLQYDSRNDGGEAGPGWSLSGLGSISRCNKTFAQDGAPAAVNLSVSDGYCLDGKRLRLVSGSYGAAGSTYQTELAEFSRVTAVSTAGNGPAYFLVQRKDGRSFEYGNSNDGGATNTSRITAAGTTPYQWLLNKVQDRNGNAYIITYGAGQSGSTGIGVPLSISYTATSLGASTYRYSIAFSYMQDTADGTEVAYIAGGSTANNNLLTRIEVKRIDVAKSLKTYALEYEFSPTSNRRRLASVQECADQALTACLAPTTVAYQNGAQGVSSVDAAAVTNATYVFGQHDINGDGRGDVVHSAGGSLYVSFGGPSGYGAPSNTGIAVSSSDKVDAADVLARGQEDIVVVRGVTIQRYFWNGAGFGSETVSTLLQSGEVVLAGPFFADFNGDGLPDLLSAASNAQTLYIRPNTSSASSLSISSTRSTAYTPSAGHSIVGLRMETDRHEKLDFNGDGRDDVMVAIYGSLVTGSFGLVSNGTAFSSYAQYSNAPQITAVKLLNWNDDGCTDTIYTAVRISACNGLSSQSIPMSGVMIGSMDWNGDGRSDVLLNSGGNIGVRLSTGGGVGPLIATSIPVPGQIVLLDHDGDGLDDLGSLSAAAPYSLTFRTHAAAGIWPDMASRITDGYGIAFEPRYESLASGSYTKGTGAQRPQRDVVAPIHIVKSYLGSDGSGGTFTKTYTYLGARDDTQGRGFLGFQSITTADNRSGWPTAVSSFRTDFPFIGIQHQMQVFQKNTATLIATSSNTPASITLSNASGQQRYFPYLAETSTSLYEVGGPKNASLIRQINTSSVYDNFGNATTTTTTVTDKDAGVPVSPTFNQTWTSVVTDTISPDTSNWCLGVPIQRTVIKSATNVPAISRVTSFVPDYVKCRVSQATIEPNSSVYKVTIGLGYDGFGNLNSKVVTGINMVARTTTANWGTTGQFLNSTTNALSQTSSYGYNFDRGELSSQTDPNNLVTSRTVDAFGRTELITRPDGTSTLQTYSSCANVPGGCQQGDPLSPATSINQLVIQVSERDASGAQIFDSLHYLDQFERTIVTKTRTLTGGYSRIGFQYDAQGRMYRRTMPCDSANCSLYWVTDSFDPLNRLTARQRPVSASNSATQNTTYSYLGSTRSKTDAEGKSTTKAYDPNGWMRSSTDHNGYGQTFSYDAFGNVLAVADTFSNTLFTATWDYGLDAFRRQTNDIDMGAWSYVPNALGEVAASTDANGNAFTYTYDRLSRPLTRSVPGEGTITWTWGNSAPAHNIGQLESMAAAGNTTETYRYDSLGRLDQVKIDSDASYYYNLTYRASDGEIDTVTYPTSTSSYRLKLQYAYQNGFLKSVSDFNAPSTVFWQGTAMNARQQVTQETLGNGVVTTSQFDTVTGWLSSLQSGIGGGSTVRNEAFQYDKVGNLTQRQDIGGGLTETFTYDQLHRLDFSKLNGVTNLDMDYDATGNIANRCEPTCGPAWTYHATKKHAVVQASVGSTNYTYGYDSNGNVTSRNGQTIAWSRYNYPTQINGPGENIALFYDGNFRRWKQIYTQGAAVETTIYVGEFLEKVANGTTIDWRHSIVADGKVVALVSRASTGTNTTRYLLHDHQGSPKRIMQAGGSTVVSESFSAFGSRRNPATWSGSPTGSDLAAINGITRSGFTGHTALGSLGLNHMGGRVQDSMTGRFLSADPFVADTGLTQGFNRYSYAYNNPVTNLDPSGFFVESSGGGYESDYPEGENPEETQSVDLGEALQAIWAIVGKTDWGKRQVSGAKKDIKKGAKKLTRALKKLTRKLFGRGHESRVIVRTPAQPSPGFGDIDSTSEIEVEYSDDFELEDLLEIISPVGEAQAAGVPGRGYNIDLHLHERLGGHTLERHVGKSVEYLRRRSVDSGWDRDQNRWTINEASTYPDEKVAKAVTNKILNLHSDIIQSCMKHDQCSIKIATQFDRVTGVTVNNARGDPVPVMGGEARIGKDPRLPEGFLLRTSFPRDVPQGGVQ